MDPSSDWATLTQRLRHVKNDNENNATSDNVSLVSVEGAGRGVRAERDLAGGQVMAVMLICQQKKIHYNVQSQCYTFPRLCLRTGPWLWAPLRCQGPETAPGVSWSPPQPSVTSVGWASVLRSANR